MDVDQLLARLENRDARERQIALTWVGHYKITNFLGDVLRLLQFDPEKQVRERAAWALDMMQHPASIPALLDALSDAEFQVRSSAGWALVHFGEPIVPEVVEVLKNGSMNAREMAFLVLDRIPSEAAREAIRKYWR